MFLATQPEDPASSEAAVRSARREPRSHQSRDAVIRRRHASGTQVWTQTKVMPGRLLVRERGLSAAGVAIRADRCSSTSSPMNHATMQAWAGQPPSDVDATRIPSVTTTRAAPQLASSSRVTSSPALRSTAPGRCQESCVSCDYRRRASRPTDARDEQPSSANAPLARSAARPRALAAIQPDGRRAGRSRPRHRDETPAARGTLADASAMPRPRHRGR